MRVRLLPEGPVFHVNIPAAAQPSLDGVASPATMYNAPLSILPP